MLRRFFITALIATPLVACTPEYEGDPPPIYKPGVDPAFIGRWIEVLPGGDGDGFELFADGTAASIDQLELNYVSWRAERGKLFLTTAKTVGNVLTTTETEYLATLDEAYGLRLDQDGDDNWPRGFRKIG